MTVIDIRTFFAGYVLSILLCAIVMTSLWWQNRKRSPEIALWLTDYVMQFIGLLLITFRGILPDFATIVLANLFVIGGTIILYTGLGRYAGKESRQWHNYVMLAVFMLVHAYFTYVYPDIALRTVNLSFALLYICAQVSWLMLRRVNYDLRPATKATGIVFILFCLVSIAQIAVNLTIPKTHNIFVSGFFNLIAILLYQILFIALTFALFLLVSRRLSMELERELSQRLQAQEELRQSEEKFAKAFQTSPYAIAITRMKDGKFIEVNDAFANLTGYSREELTATSSIGLKLWVDEKNRQEIVSLLSREMPVNGKEFLFRKKNGEILTGLFSAQMIRLGHEPCLLSSIDDITKRKQAEWELKERFKELNCLYGISSLIETTGISLDEIFQSTVMLLPPAMQFPEITEARITLEEQAFQTQRFQETQWMLTQKIIVNGKQAGQIEVCYLEERSLNDKGLFLKDERQLLIAIAQRLGHVIERERTEGQIRLNETRLMSLLNIMQYRTKTTQEFLDYALDEVIKLTQSKIGYIYFYNEDTRQFILNTWSKDVMKECTIANPQTCYELEKTGIWGESVRQRKPIVLNDFQAAHPLKKGYPEGHAHLNKFVTVPVFKDDAIVAVVGVANKSQDYGEDDVLQLTLLMDAVWKSVDIKIAEEKLRESEERISAITNSANDAIAMMDNNGNITYWNPAAEHILGYTKEETIGKNLHELIAPERFRPAFLTAFPEFQRTGHGNAIGKTLELAARRKDGREIDVALSLSAVNIKGAWNAVGIIQDITERKKSEKSLSESEERYRFIANNTADHIWTMDLSLHFIYSSPAVTKILGYTVDELTALKIDHFFTPESLIAATEMLAEELKTDKDPDADPNRIRTFQTEHYHKDGKTIWVESSITFIRDAYMKPIGILGVSRDISERRKNEEALRQSESFLNTLLNSIPIPVFYKNRAGQYTGFNKAYETFFGATKETLIGKTVFDISPPELANIYYDKDNELFQSRSEQHYESQVKNIFGETRDVIFNKAVLADSQGNVSGLIGAILDITERKKAERALKETSDYLNNLIKYANAPIITWNPDFTITSFNHAFERMSGMKAEEVLGKKLDILFPKDSKKESISRIRQTLSGKFWESVEIPILRNDGSVRTALWNSANIYGADGKTLVSTIAQGQDITERKQAEDQIKHLATHDLMTNLPTLRLAMDRLSSAINIARRHKKSAAVMFIDLDGFKAVNDTLGHDAGDYVLKQVAQRMLSCVRETDTVARVGGDEFLIIATEINTPDNVVQVAEKVLQLVSQPIIFEGQKAVVSTSIGIALFPDHSEDMDKLIKLADEAMYKVKNAGKNGFRFVDIMTE
jgi:diguanylate cyclase (GGDEF)-like protein/PAS domain S-box-containing protein